jgi:hypothetical protein
MWFKKPEWINVALSAILVLQGFWIIGSKQEVSWAKIIVATVIVLALLLSAYFTYKTARLKSGAQTPPPPDLLKNQARQFAINRINELFAEGDSLTTRRPGKDADDSTFAEFWNQEVRAWTSVVSSILHQNWSAAESQAFLSTAGENPDQFAIGVHPKVVRVWIELNRRLKNLDFLKRDLGRL